MENWGRWILVEKLLWSDISDNEMIFSIPNLDLEMSFHKITDTFISQTRIYKDEVVNRTQNSDQTEIIEIVPLNQDYFEKKQKTIKHKLTSHITLILSEFPEDDAALYQDFVEAGIITLKTKEDIFQNNSTCKSKRLQCLLTYIIDGDLETFTSLLTVMEKWSMWILLENLIWVI